MTVKVSICICTCSRPAMLGRLLGSLRDVELGALEASAVEIVVVDNDPSGSARAVCETAAARLPFPIHFAEESRRGIAFARDRLVREALARGADFLALLDDDDVPERDWLRRLLERQQETGAEVVAGMWRWRIGPEA
ncbi:MAG: glycosyltransferase family 2 protein, partial [Myxococcota bacterium]